MSESVGERQEFPAEKHEILKSAVAVLFEKATKKRMESLEKPGHAWGIGANEATIDSDSMQEFVSKIEDFTLEDLQLAIELFEAFWLEWDPSLRFILQAILFELRWLLKKKQSKDGMVDPYEGLDPRDVWNAFSGARAGFEPEDKDGKKQTDYWDTFRICMEDNGIDSQLRDRRVIELGCGESILFRDYCVKNEASEYVGVDLFRAKPSDQLIATTRVITVGQDAWKYLSEQPANSAIIAEYMFLRGEMVSKIPGRNRVEVRTLARAIAEQIYRVQIPGLNVLTFSSHNIFEEEFLRAGFKKDTDRDLFVK